MAKLPPLPTPGNEPQTFWEKVLTMTPVVMTVIATVLAGLSNSEMTQSQYHRTMAAEIQSKAGDQWGFFQAKKLRALSMRNTLDLLRGMVEIGPIDKAQIAAGFVNMLVKPQPAAQEEQTQLRADLEKLSAAPADAWTAVQSGDPIGMKPWEPRDPMVKAALEDIAASAPQEQLAPAIAQVKEKMISQEIDDANTYAKALDTALEPANKIADQIESALGLAAQLAGHEKTGSVDPRQLSNNLTAARLRYSAARYETEARHNQSTALLYEVQVRVESALSDRHRTRSQRFFFGMLGTQMAVVVSSLSLAMQRKNLLWSFAAAVGLAAMSFAGYVYLFV
jgi:hypothetical protein